jgi:FKBP-type peptidyl-prolyl cis-trans isomerase
LRLILRLDVTPVLLDFPATATQITRNNNYMKSCLIPALALVLLVSSVSAQEKPDLTDPRQKTSYALGMDILATLKQQEVDVDTKAIAAGMADMEAGKPALTPEQQKAVMKDLHQNIMAKAAEKQKAAAENNLKEGQAFLAANAKKQGVKVKEVVAPDGSKAELQYKILKSGAGPSPQKTDTVKVHYHGTLIDGTVFDSSVNRGVPATFIVNLVIPGWTEALQMMKVGDKWQLFIPAKLGYGELAPPKIGPNSTLIFDIELLGIEKRDAANSAPDMNTPSAPAK